MHSASVLQLFCVLRSASVLHQSAPFLHPFCINLVFCIWSASVLQLFCSPFAFGTHFAVCTGFASVVQLFCIFSAICIPSTPFCTHSLHHSEFCICSATLLHPFCVLHPFCICFATVLHPFCDLHPFYICFGTVLYTRIEVILILVFFENVENVSN